MTSPDETNPTRVLIIEDEPLIVLDLRSILTELGCTVCAVAGTADEAVAAAKRHTPDLILADIRLPGPVDGIDAVKMIQTIRPVPVLFVTGNWRELRARGLPDAMAIGKPFLPGVLRQAITTVIGNGN
ncbi:response regulator [Azospirillum soli]|uniref:response regulator n=1 Tax=Azospirillum soli TaxID=1304799 RepID=UPI001AEA620F|nr:response regulator [Azospirillum soli]MBP2314650.1 CheY-like chemotaxis protein [Azospirillum soli]